MGADDDLDTEDDEEWEEKEGDSPVVFPPKDEPAFIPLPPEKVEPEEPAPPVEEEGESIFLESFEGTDVQTDYGINAKRLNSAFGYGDSTSSVIIKKTQILKKAEWMDISNCSRMKVKFAAFPQGYGDGEGFSLESKLRYQIKGGGWTIDTWNVEKEWKKDALIMNQWNELESPEFEVTKNIE